MTGPGITNALNDLVRQGVLATWHRSTHRGAIRWIVVPPAGPSVPYTRAGIVDYIEFAQELMPA